MKYKLNNIKLSINHTEKEFIKKVEQMLNISFESIKEYKIVGKSIDARKKDNIFYVYTIDFDLKKDDTKILEKNYVSQNNKDSILKEINEIYVENVDKRPVVVGSGPAGLFAALMLSKWNLKPIIIERGEKVEDRVKDVYRFFNSKGNFDKFKKESNVQFGEGGAGTFSDGKLTTNTHNKYIEIVIDELVKFGAKEEIRYLSKPHIGTDELVKILIKIRKYIISKGGEYRFSNKFIDFKEENNALKKAIIRDLVNEIDYEIETNHLILAVGHSARDTFYMLRDRNIEMIKKPFSVGVRIEHKREYIDKHQYGKFYKKLPAAEYKLNARLENGRGVYTFCMCPGGVVVPAASEENRLVVNGMSYSKRDKENSNSAILVDIRPEDLGEDVLSGVEFQRQLEEKAFNLGGSNYFAPVQLVEDFINNKKSEKILDVVPSYSIGYTLSNLNDCFPDYISYSLREGLKLLNNKFKDFSKNPAILTAVESRSSSPIRIIRDDNYNSNIKGIIPSGEGAGYAGGIMSAAVDGIKCAFKVLENVKSN